MLLLLLLFRMLDLQNGGSVKFANIVENFEVNMY